MTTLDSELRQEAANRQRERDRALAGGMLNNARLDVDPNQLRMKLTDQQSAGRQDQQRDESQDLQAKAPACSTENRGYNSSSKEVYSVKQLAGQLQLNMDQYGGSRVVLK